MNALMTKMKVLAVDDNRTNLHILQVFLKKLGHDVILAENGEEAVARFQSESPDLVLLDIMMPVMDGFTAIVKIRETRGIPIIVLSAKSEDSDKILGLGIGADDYITKPYNPLELVARVKSLLRRSKVLSSHSADGEDIITIGGLRLDRKAKSLTVDGEPVKLTATEYGILELLMSNKGRVFSAEAIYSSVWNEECFAVENTVMVHIRHIREKIEINPREPKYLKVAWGIGYKIEG